MEIKIIYGGPIVDEIRKGMNIPRIFEPTNSYVDSPVYTEGYDPTAEGAYASAEAYGKSIYATNVDGWNFFPGLIPMNGNTTKFAQFQRAIFAAKDAEEKGAENTGITFEIDGYEEEIYWTQMGRNMVDQGFYTKVGDEEFGKVGN